MKDPNMVSHITKIILSAGLILGLSLASNAATIVQTDFDRSPSGTYSGTITDSLVWSGLESATASQLTPLAGNPTIGTDLFSTDPDHSDADAIYIDDRFDGGQAQFRGYSFTLTPSSTYTLTDVTMTFGFRNGTNGNQGAGGGTVRFMISGGTVDYTSGDFTETVIAGSGNLTSVTYGATQGLDNITLSAGTTYTITAGVTNPVFNAFLYANQNGESGEENAGFQLTGFAPAIPEPSTLGLVFIGGTALNWIRRKKA